MEIGSGKKQNIRQQHQAMATYQHVDEWKSVREEDQFMYQVVYISPHRPDDPRRIANLKLCLLCQTHEVINPTDFQLDPPH